MFCQSFTFVSLLVSTLLELVSLLFFHRVGFNHISLGPSALIFSILYQYSRIVPPVYAYRVFGVSLNNKSVNYFLALQVFFQIPLKFYMYVRLILQLAISRLPSSLVVAFIGIISGQIYRSDLAGLNSYRLPLSIIRLSERVLYPLIGSLRPPRRSNRALPDDAQTGRNNDGMGRNEEVITTARTPRQAANARNSDIAPPAADPTPSVMQEWVNELTGRADRENVGLRVPTDAEITHLTSMFPTIGREVIVAALQRR